jgi:TM2 domain-containing membrane protein YozV
MFYFILKYMFHICFILKDSEFILRKILIGYLELKNSYNELIVLIIILFNMYRLMYVYIEFVLPRIYYDV